MSLGSPGSHKQGAETGGALETAKLAQGDAASKQVTTTLLLKKEEKEEEGRKRRGKKAELSS